MKSLHRIFVGSEVFEAAESIVRRSATPETHVQKAEFDEIFQSLNKLTSVQ